MRLRGGVPLILDQDRGAALPLDPCGDIVEFLVRAERHTAVGPVRVGDRGALAAAWRTMNADRAAGVPGLSLRGGRVADGDEAVPVLRRPRSSQRIGPYGE